VLTVFATMLAAGVGGFIWWLADDGPDKTAFFLESVVAGTFIAGGMFLVWAGLVAVTAGQMARDQGAALAATVRTLSFASLPFALAFFVFIPGLEFVVTLLAVALLLLSMTLATQRALGGSVGRALGANVVGFFLWLLVLTTLMSDAGTFAPGVFLWDRLA
jgi:hypothetical protein